MATCNEDFCEECGDCLACYGDDPCIDGGPHQWAIPSGATMHVPGCDCGFCKIGSTKF